MANPKPVSFTQEDTNPSSFAPEPMVLVGALPDGAVDWTAISGYDAGEDQTLKNSSGTIEWVTDTL